MSNFLVFLSEHWVLTTVLGVSTVAYILLELLYNEDEAKLSPEFAVTYINRGKCVVIDLREESLYSKGHVAGAICISAASSGGVNFSKLERYAQKNVLLTCDNGKMSRKLCQQLKRRKFKDIAYLGGGIQAWVAAGLPLTAAKG